MLSHSFVAVCSLKFVVHSTSSVLYTHAITSGPVKQRTKICVWPHWPHSLGIVGKHANDQVYFSSLVQSAKAKSRGEFKEAVKQQTRSKCLNITAAICTYLWVTVVLPLIAVAVVLVVLLVVNQPVNS